jgi:hypothetical protein
VAKTTKKVLKKKTKKLKTKVVEKAPEVESGLINIGFTRADLSIYVNLLSIMAQTFEQLALSSADGNDTKSFDILSARHRLTVALANRFVLHHNIGEPESRDIH